jgi:hypothetical protein
VCMAHMMEKVCEEFEKDNVKKYVFQNL